MRARVKTLIALALLAVLGFAAAGCGATKKKTVVYHDGQAMRSSPITFTGTTTVPNVATGTLIHCKGGPSAKVPRRGATVAAGEDKLSPVGTPPPTTPSRAIQLTHLQNGSVTVSCTPSN